MFSDYREIRLVRGRPAVRRWIMVWAMAFSPQLTSAVDKSGVTPNTISLPEGPGSIEGLGESFQPTLNTGTAKYQVPLNVPPGTAGHQPSLALRYDAGRGNGPCGFGWTMEPPYIQRQTDEGIPRYVDTANGVDDDLDGTVDEHDELDIFVNEMKEELVPLANGDVFCRTEGAFIRYRRIGDHWEGTLPDGTRMTFGSTPSARVVDDTTGRVYKWCCDAVVDTHGNTIQHSYTNFPGAHNTNQVYLAQTTYGPGAPPWSAFHYIVYTYEPRLDWFEDGRPAFLVRTGMRISEIVIGTQGVALENHASGDFNRDGTTDSLNRKYEINYYNEADANQHWSLLGEVVPVGADGTNTLPSITFTYSVCNPSNTVSAAGRIIGGLNEPSQVMDFEEIDLVDLNGDALPDILRTVPFGGVHQGYLNLGQRQIDGSQAIRWAAAQYLSSADGRAWIVDLGKLTEIAHLADINGDGMADLTYRTAVGSTYWFENHGDLSWGPQMDLSTTESPPSPFDPSGNVKTADIDFDKRIDLIQSDLGGLSYQVWFNQGAQAYSQPVTIPQANGYVFSDEGVGLVDMNGDRVTDVAKIQVSDVEVTAGLGYGNFAPRVVMPFHGLLDLDQLAQARMRDVTGDGLADLVVERAASGVLWYWINQGNYTFSDQHSITGMPVGLGFNPSIRWADLNGNGTTDLVYSDSATSPKIQTVDVGELIGCSSATMMLTGVDNGIGLKTTIHYDPSTRFLLEDLDQTNAWPDPLPFPVNVVSRVVLDDSLGNTYVTEYRYHDGYYDAAEQQFRGFAKVEQIEVGDPTAPTLVTRSHFDTGREYEAMKGKLLRLSAEQEDGAVFWDELTTWTVPPRTLYLGINGTNVTYVHPAERARLVKELGQGTERRLEWEYAYDDFGNLTTNTEYGIVEFGNRAAFDDERITVTEYALNLTDWLVRYPSRSEIMDENGAVISRTENYYDDETFSGTNLTAISTGLLTMVRSWHDATNGSAFVTTLRNIYDTHGNVTHILDALAAAPGGVLNLASGHVREITYDTLFSALPVAEIIHVGGGSDALRTEVAYDAGLGTMASSTDFNGHPTLYQHDVHGRLTGFVRPGDTPAYPSVAFDYVLAEPFVTDGRTGIVNYVETLALDKEPGTAADHRSHYFISRAFVDGMGRPLMSRTEAGTNGVTVTGAVTFNARHHPVAQFNPYYAAELGFEDVAAPGWQRATNKTETLYDATLRPIRSINPDGTFSETVYEPLVSINYDENDSDPFLQYSNTPLLHHQDGLGRLVRVDEVVRLNDDGTRSEALHTWSTLYEYDVNDNLTRITDSQGNVKILAYDGLGRKTFMDDPDRGIMDWAYDDVGNLVQQGDAKAQRVVFAYDGVNRLISKDCLDEGLPFSANRTPDVAYHYDVPVVGLDMGRGVTGTSENAKGHLSYVVDLSGEKHISYDRRGRIAWEVKRIADPATDVLASFATHWSYDAMDRVTSIQYPDQDSIQYAYNDRSLVARVHSHTAGDFIRAVSYLPSGQVAVRDYGNNVRTCYAYDERLRLTTLDTRHATQGTSLLCFAYTFDPAANITRIDDARPGSAVPEGDPLRNTQLFAYDDLYRLTRAQYSFNLPGSPDRNDGVIAYRYDRIGNMLAKTSSIDHMENGLPVTNPGQMLSGGSLGTWGRISDVSNGPPGPHALTEIRHPTLDTRHFPYDANGNILDIDGLHCTWDFLDRLVTVSNAGMVAHYTYDFAGRRISKFITVSGTREPETNSVTYINRFYEIRDGQPIKYVWDGDTRIARLTETRVQEYDLQAGWNLCSIAVQSDSAAAQLGVGSPSIEHCFRWVGPTQDWERVEADEPLCAGSVFWLKSATDIAVSVSGLAPELVGRTTRTNGDFLPCPGLDAISLGDLVPPEAEARMYDTEEGHWRARYSADGLTSASDSSTPVEPGTAVSIGITEASLICVPDPTQVVRYYHEDHLASTSCLSDDEGRLIEERSFYPFGQIRLAVQRIGQTSDSHKYLGMEHDRETGAQFHGARFYSTGLARFFSADPLYATLSFDSETQVLPNPQRLSLYGYALNNPLVYRDRSGHQPATLWEQREVLMEKLSFLGEMEAHFEREIEIWSANCEKLEALTLQEMKAINGEQEADMIGTLASLPVSMVAGGVGARLTSGSVGPGVTLVDSAASSAPGLLIDHASGSVGPGVSDVVFAGAGYGASYLNGSGIGGFGGGSVVASFNLLWTAASARSEIQDLAYRVAKGQHELKVLREQLELVRVKTTQVEISISQLEWEEDATD